MAVMALSEVLKNWLEVRFGGELPTEPIPITPPVAGAERQLEMPWSGPDRGVYHPVYLGRLEHKRRARGRRPIPSRP